jgi:hypothetical protein
MLWQVQSFPPCTYHVFLSHCREDRDALAIPLHEALERRGITTWLDRHDYPYGRASFEALRGSILDCRHTVFLVTEAMVRQPRGWSIVELAWAQLLQENLLQPGGELQAVSLPLFFLDPTAEPLLRSAWRVLRDRGAFHRAVDGDRMIWALQQICQFVRREEIRGLRFAAWLEQEPKARPRFEKPQGLIERITCRQPAAIAPP